MTPAYILVRTASATALLGGLALIVAAFYLPALLGTDLHMHLLQTGVCLVAVAAILRVLPLIARAVRRG